jgi:putative redox protein
MAIRVVRDVNSPMRHNIEIGDYHLATDISVAEGGGGSAPSPHDLYDAALGACKALTVLWYAKRKGFLLANVDVSIGRDDSQERAGTYKLNAVLTLTGDLNAQERKELLQVAQKCPIHKLMTEVTTEIVTTLSGEG